MSRLSGSGFIKLSSKEVTGSLSVFVPAPVEVGKEIDLIGNGVNMGKGTVTSCEEIRPGEYELRIDWHGILDLP